MKMVRARVVVEGIVQGVYFRATTTEVARENGVRGWVRNRPDGTVEAVMEGAEPAVKKVIEWCHEGPPMARVTGVSVEWADYADEFDDFHSLTSYNTY